MKKDNFSLEVITPERVLISQNAASIVLPAGNGSLGILPGHAPLISTVGIGILKVRDTSKKEKQVFVNDGFIMVSLEGVTILVRSAEAGEKIDVRAGQLPQSVPSSGSRTVTRLPTCREHGMPLSGLSAGPKLPWAARPIDRLHNT